MFYRSCATYGPAYRAACHYGQAAIRAAAALRVPAVYTAAVEDMLYPHLRRLPALKDGQIVETLASAEPARSADIKRFLGGFAATGPAPAAVAGGGGRMFVEAAGGQVFARRYGAGDETVILLHDAPGTGLGLHEVAVALAETRQVVVPDQPGCGLTSLPDGDLLEAAAANVLAVADAVGAETFAVAALGCGAAVAARLAGRAAGRMTRLVVAGLPIQDAAAADDFAPEIALDATGAHWVRAWLMIRDGQIYAPWFDGSVAAQRRVQGNFDAAWLHARTVALMEGRATYHHYPRAALRGFVPVPDAVLLAGEDFNAATLADLL